MWNLKNDRGEPICRNRDADLENGHADTGGERGGWMNWEIRIDIYILPCIK